MLTFSRSTLPSLLRSSRYGVAACVHAMMHSDGGGDAFSCAPQEMLVVGADGVETVMTRMACDAAVPRFVFIVNSTCTC